MSARAARRLAAAAAFGGGGLGAAGAASYGVLRLQARVAKRAINAVQLPRTFDADGEYGGGAPATGEARDQAGPAGNDVIRMAVFGDSAAAGYGSDLPEQTLGARLAVGVADATGRRVVLRSYAVVGARSSGLVDQLERAEGTEPDLVLIVVGGNDVTNRVPPSESVRQLDAAVRRLRAAGAEVVVGTCPDLGTIEPIPHPLRLLARRWSRQLAAAQTVAVVEAGGRTVSLGSILGPDFSSTDDLFSADRFHPSAAGYAAAAQAILPSMLSALGLDEHEHELQPLRGDSHLPVSVAAVAAAQRSGAEVSAGPVGGRDHGRRGRWVQLRHRPRRPAPADTLDETTDQTTDETDTSGGANAPAGPAGAPGRAGADG